MKKTVVLFHFLIISIFSIAQNAGNVLYNQSNRWASAQHIVQQKAYVNNMNEFNLDINCMHNTKADSYLAIFHITQIGENARQADSLINNRITQFKKSLTKRGILDSKIVIDMLTMIPLYEMEVTKKRFSKTYNEVPAGFEIQKNIHIHFDDESILDGIITAAAINEIYDLVKVDYYVKNTQAIYEEMREKAIELVNKRIEELEEVGISMEGQWRMVADQIGVYFPFDRYQSYQAFSNTSVEAIHKRANITQMKKPTTLYYNKIPYTNYDIIINPEIIEPAVQYTYNLSVKFQLKQPKEEEKVAETKETETKYVMITDKGDFRELQIKE